MHALSSHYTGVKSQYTKVLTHNVTPEGRESSLQTIYSLVCYPFCPSDLCARPAFWVPDELPSPAHGHPSHEAITGAQTTKKRTYAKTNPPASKFAPGRIPEHYNNVPRRNPNRMRSHDEGSFPNILLPELRWSLPGRPPASKIDSDSGNEGETGNNINGSRFTKTRARGRSLLGCACLRATFTAAPATRRAGAPTPRTSMCKTKPTCSSKCSCKTKPTGSSTFPCKTKPTGSSMHPCKTKPTSSSMHTCKTKLTGRSTTPLANPTSECKA